MPMKLSQSHIVGRVEIERGGACPLVGPLGGVGPMAHLSSQLPWRLIASTYDSVHAPCPPTRFHAPWRPSVRMRFAKAGPGSQSASRHRRCVRRHVRQGATCNE